MESYTTNFNGGTPASSGFRGSSLDTISGPSTTNSPGKRDWHIYQTEPRWKSLAF